MSTMQITNLNSDSKSYLQSFDSHTTICGCGQHILIKWFVYLFYFFYSSEFPALCAITKTGRYSIYSQWKIQYVHMDSALKWVLI